MAERDRLIGDFGANTSALAAMQPDEAVVFHGLEGAGQIRGFAARAFGQLLKRRGLRRGDSGQQRTVLIRERPGKALRRGEPYLGPLRLRLQAPARNRHRADFHCVLRGDSDFQGLHGITPFSRSHRVNCLPEISAELDRLNRAGRQEQGRASYTLPSI